MQANELYAEYDFIVLGDHPAALWGALFLLKQGLKVLILPLGESRMQSSLPRFVVEDFEFTAKEVEIPDREMDPVQILTSSKRFRVFSSRESLEEEHFFVYGKKLGPNDLLEPEMVRGLAYLYRGSEPGPVLPEDWSSVFSRASDMIYFNHNEAWLVEKMLKKLIAFGAHVLAPKKVQRIFVENKAFVGVQAEGTSSIIHAQQVLVGTNWNRITPYFNEEIPAHSEPLGWMFEMKLKIEADSLPLGLSSYFLYVQETAPIIEVRHQKGDFVVRTVLPFENHTLDHHFQRAIAERLLGVLSSIIPDLEYNLKSMVPDLRDPENAEQVELARMYPYHTLNDIPPSRLRYRIPGIGHKSSVSGMILAYEESYPRWGEWGAYYAVQLGIQDWAKSLQKPELSRIEARI